jgi:hypothetical protein
LIGLAGTIDWTLEFEAGLPTISKPTKAQTKPSRVQTKPWTLIESAGKSFMGGAQFGPATRVAAGGKAVKTVSCHEISPPGPQVAAETLGINTVKQQIRFSHTDKSNVHVGSSTLLNKHQYVYEYFLKRTCNKMRNFTKCCLRPSSWPLSLGGDTKINIQKSLTDFTFRNVLWMPLP